MYFISIVNSLIRIFIYLISFDYFQEIALIIYFKECTYIYTKRAFMYVLVQLESRYLGVVFVARVTRER